jgi:hypothetical protein
VTDERELRHIFAVLGPATCDVIERCAHRGYGSRRDLRGTLATAEEFGVDPRVVAAALGFLPNYDDPAGYVDVPLGDETDLARLPADPAVRAAFALSRMVHDAGCSFVVE